MENNTMSKSIEEKIIDVLFEKNRINFVMKDNLAKFLKEKYEPEIKMSKIRIDRSHPQISYTCNIIRFCNIGQIRTAAM